jgi:Na+-driven multidrug efflux pump
MGKTKEIMNVSIVMNAINVVGNAIGIFGLHAGVAGVAYPSLLSRFYAAAVMFYLSMQKENTVYIRLRQVFTWQQEMIGRIFHIALPGSVENGLFQISKVALSSIVAMFGTAQIAANGVAQSFWSMASLFCMAMGPVFITVIGQYMGAGDRDGADYYMVKLLKITYVAGILWGLVFFVLAPLVLRFFDLSEEASHLALFIVLLHNGFNCLLCPLCFSMSNGLRAAGDVKFTMYASIFSTVICRVALSILFGIVMDLGVIGITIAMIADWAIHAVLVAWRYRGGKWKTFQVI